MFAVTLEVDFIDPDTHKVICFSHPDVKYHLIHDRNLLFNICKNLPKDGYIVHLVDPGHHSHNLIFDESLEIGDEDFLYITRKVHASEEWNFTLHHGNIFSDIGGCGDGLRENRWYEFGLLIVFDFNSYHYRHHGSDDEDCDGKANDYSYHHYRGHSSCDVHDDWDHVHFGGSCGLGKDFFSSFFGF